MHFNALSGRFFLVQSKEYLELNTHSDFHMLFWPLTFWRPTQKDLSNPRGHASSETYSNVLSDAKHTRSLSCIRPAFALAGWVTLGVLPYDGVFFLFADLFYLYKVSILNEWRNNAVVLPSAIWNASKNVSVGP